LPVPVASESLAKAFFFDSKMNLGLGGGMPGGLDFLSGGGGGVLGGGGGGGAQYGGGIQEIGGPPRSGGMSMPPGFGGAGMPGAPGGPEPTPEEQQQMMMQYAEWMAQLQAEDPVAYEKMVAQLMASAPAGAGGPGGAPPERTEEEMKQFEAQLNAMQDMYKEKDFEAKMPGTDSVMGAGGLKKKQEEGIEVIPDPGFVLKTVSLGADPVKVFINICQSEKLQAPSVQKRLDDKGEEQEGINIPLSLGPELKDTDKSGKVCLVYDCIVNPVCINQALEDKSGNERTFLCNLAMNYVEQKSKRRLNPKFKLPKLKYQGETPRAQMIRKAALKPVIEEVSSSKVEEPKAKKKKRAPEQQTFMSHRLLRCDGNGIPDYPVGMVAASEGGAILRKDTAESDFGGYPVELVLEVDLSGKMPDPESVKVNVSTEMIVVKAAGYHDIDLFLPFPVVEGEVEASLSEDEQQLVVVMQVARDIDYTDRTGPDRGSNAWLLAQALEDETDRTSTQAASKEDGKVETDLDPFQLKPPSTYLDKTDPITGHLLDEYVNPDDEELPEDKFHRKDMISQSYIDQKKKEIDDKRKAHEDEKKEREEAGGAPYDPDVAMTMEDVEMDKDGEMKFTTKEQVKMSDLNPNYKNKAEAAANEGPVSEIEQQAADRSRQAAAEAAKQFSQRQAPGKVQLSSLSSAFELLD
jgi:hypothetical protein